MTQEDPVSKRKEWGNGGREGEKGEANNSILASIISSEESEGSSPSAWGPESLCISPRQLPDTSTVLGFRVGRLAKHVASGETSPQTWGTRVRGKGEPLGKQENLGGGAVSAGSQNSSLPPCSRLGALSTQRSPGVGYMRLYLKELIHHRMV